MLKYKKRSRLFGNKSVPTTLLIILEIFAIVIGVIIGFAVNEWRENRNNQKIAENALINIATEMAHNHRQVESNYYYYTHIVEQIDSLYQIMPEKVMNMHGYELEGWSGAQPPMLRSSAYQMVLMTGIIKDFPYDTANELANIYNVQSVVERLDDSMVGMFASDPNFASLPTIRHMFGVYSEILPSVMIGYQLSGRIVLKEFGYDLALTDGNLKDIINAY